MNHALYIGRVSHQRFLPRSHGFSYPFFMWYFDLDRLADLPDLRPWFSVDGFALSRLHRNDYLGPPDEPLADSVRSKMLELTGQPVTGHVTGLMNLRTLGLYFSPVNFYFGHEPGGTCTHLLAEVSNTPWNERHHYSFFLEKNDPRPTHAKAFKVSPFNPVTQRYRWRIEPPTATAGITIEVDDERGPIFAARLRLERQPLSRTLVRRLLLRRPVMTAAILAAIYWQALKLYVKGVPYIPYRKETT
ncbi:DUF1365 domain-containing protein [Desulfofustis limnaeus]|jgi:DUF1365 family protein|uniref:DUF1365 domain-containing protein n=1 Tax=Desulfofustis limnaeus TaxID=2740163 RepID=A0ABM7WBU9_9BACT|nr:DUF1365 domain-containing protein [Desulfofustis limnaeus]MDX9895509.1 DUF1365 domain-containing protein [Desulfofustis sp.]BDD88398.1 DUF1365 domain-containing protein [Desulfofustis limnaeus]